MFTIAGVTGHVGPVVATTLLDAGQPVRVLVRDRAKAAHWSARGAEVAVVDLTDRAGLARALSGSTGFFTLLPFTFEADDIAAATDRLVASIAGATADSGVAHVALLSSAGADLDRGIGPILGLHHLEQSLRATGATVSALRSGHFQEKVNDVLDVAQQDGIYPVFAASAQRPVPMVATADIGAVAARTLLRPPAAHETVDLVGPAYTETQVAEALGAAIGRRLEVLTLPREAWIPSLTSAGFTAAAAAQLAELYEADERGDLAPRGDRTVRTTTELESTLRALLDTPEPVSP